MWKSCVKMCLYLNFIQHVLEIKSSYIRVLLCPPHHLDTQQSLLLREKKENKGM